MARLIDADSILDDFLKRYTEMERSRKLVFAACEIKQDFADMISDATTVDAVEVVRCKDCKHWHKDTVFCEYMSYGEASERVNWYADDFCSYGELKDGDGND